MINSRVVLLWVAVAIAPLPLLVVHLQSLWQQEQYRYLPALFLAIVFLLWGQWDRQVQLPRWPVAWALIGIGLVLVLPAASYWYSPWLAAFAWLLFFGAFLWSHRAKVDDDGGLEAGGPLIRLWPLSWMLLPLPLNIDSMLTTQLQLRSSRLSSYVLDWIQVPHLLLGNVIELRSGRLMVEEACSGVQSLFTVVFCSVLVVTMFNRPMVLLPLYVAAGVFWAALMNISRIVAIAIAQDWYRLDLSSGWRHDVLGYVCLLMAFVLLLSTDRLIRVIFFPTKPPLDRRAKGNPLILIWNRLLGPRPSQAHSRKRAVAMGGVFQNRWLRHAIQGIGAILITMCFSLQAREMYTRFRMPTASATSPSQPFAQLPTRLPESEVGGFSQTSHEKKHERLGMPMGENADIWKGTIDSFPVAISLSQPYPEWHDLAVCYKGIGWTLNDQQLRQLATGSGEWAFIASRWLTPNGTYAYVWFSAFDERGIPVQAAESSFSNAVLGRLTERSPVRADHGRVAMVQMIAESEDVLAADVVETLERSHCESRDFLRSLVQPKVSTGE